MICFRFSVVVDARDSNTQAQLIAISGKRHSSKVCDRQAVRIVQPRHLKRRQRLALDRLAKEDHPAMSSAAAARVRQLASRINVLVFCFVSTMLLLERQTVPIACKEKSAVWNKALVAGSNAPGLCSYIADARFRYARAGGSASDISNQGTCL